MKKEKKMTCSFCEKEIDTRHSNNADPFKGRCCEECNLEYVIPTRYGLALNKAILFVQTDSESKVEMIEEDIKNLDIKDYRTLVGEGEFVRIEPVIFDVDNTTYVALVEEDAIAHGRKLNKMWKKFRYSKNTRPLYGNVLLLRYDNMKSVK